jgi:hypothetical protein
MPLAELRDPARGFLRDDTLRISATLRMTGGLPENIIIKTMTDGDIKKRVSARDVSAAFDLAELEAGPHIRVHKEMPFGQFKALAQERLHVPAWAQRWWLWAERVNGTYRPERLVTHVEDADAMSTVLKDVVGAVASASSELIWVLYLETPWLSPQPVVPLEKGILLFFKASQTRQLCFCLRSLQLLCRFEMLALTLPCPPCFACASAL